ncbi:glycoside hydrolase family 130 protein [Sphingomonas cannabina]|uniref:glycoside hydrolase family 130 protein n=1 Tax=Sphingomonas cannabina TaxID=2899123 RepID=UPI003873A3BE
MKLAKKTALDFAVEQIDVVQLDIAERPDGLLAAHDLMSPYVWEAEGRMRLLVRVLKNPLGPGDPTGIIYAGESADGLFFRTEPTPAIVPGPDDVDAGGVEDPTVVIGDEPHLLVFYTGVDGKRDQGSLLVATGPDLTHLTKDKVLLKARAGEGNIKEATVAQGTDGRYRIFYEYAKDNASRIGLAVADNLTGPWEAVEDLFTVRPRLWDTWHLSTGPILSRPGEPPVMFYNGATADARWRIGWIAFDENFTRVLDRCIEPLLVPPPPKQRAGTDIAFAASLLDRSPDIFLYYSLEDRLLRRALVRRLSGLN